MTIQLRQIDMEDGRTQLAIEHNHEALICSIFGETEVQENNDIYVRHEGKVIAIIHQDKIQ